jgi:hypothetical protein
MSPAFFDGSGLDYQLNSRLVIMRGGINYYDRLGRNVPDTYYFVWDEGTFRQIRFISGKPHHKR